MRTAKKSGHRANWVVRIVVVAAVAFALAKAIQLHMQLDQKQAQIAALADRVAIARLYNEDLAEKNENYDLEQRARENGYVYPYDQVYQFSN